jgi:hypothetical protein
MNHMTGRANGLDHSGAVIIMDYLAIKHSPFMRIIENTHKGFCLNIRKDEQNVC